jgi:hypothetical protein
LEASPNPVAAVVRFEEEKEMPYITSVERLAREEWREEGREEGEIRGLQDGIELALELKLAADGQALVPLVRAVQ